MYNVLCADERGEISYTRFFTHKNVAMMDADSQTAPSDRINYDTCVVTYWDANDELRTTYTAREGKEVTD